MQQKSVLLLEGVTFLCQYDLLMILAKEAINTSLVFHFRNSLGKDISSERLAFILTANPLNDFHNVIKLTGSFSLELMLDIHPMLFREVKA